MLVEPKTKAFKEWDKQFSAADLRIVREKYLSDFNHHKHMERWPFVVEKWSHDQVRTAVYGLDTSEDWQLFRVSLKGLSTYGKLYALKKRWDEHNSGSESMVEKCRIDNYILALVRGGQLNSNLEVIR